MKASKYAFLTFLLLSIYLLMVKIDSRHWAEPINDVEWHIQGIWFPLGISVAIFITLIVWITVYLVQIIKGKIRNIK